MPLLFFGTPEGTRTPNPRNRNPMLYPLSHRRMLDSLDIIPIFSRFVKGKSEKILSSPSTGKQQTVVFPKNL